MDPQEEDGAVQGALLRHVLDEHPTLLRQSDLLREFLEGEESWAGRDRIERAIAELVKLGLLERLHDYVLPTRPALACRLLGGA